MVFRRALSQSLQNWLTSSPKKPLLLRGARQVGKTSLVREFAKQNFSQCIELNFEEKPSLKKLFEGDLTAKTIISNIELVSQKRITPKDTLIFFDEIQECPSAIKALRYFYEQTPEQSVIAAGSLLEFALEKISFPVGRVESLFVHPMNFEEFLWATEREKLCEYLPRISQIGDLDKVFKSSSTATDLLEQALREYFLVGGMPEVIKRYVDTKSWLEVQKIQDQLLLSFTDDARKYIKRDSQLENISNVLRQIPQYIGQEINYTTLGEGDSHLRTKKSLEFLTRAMLCTMVYSTSPAAHPLATQMKIKHFKCLYIDVGLASRLLEVNPLLILKDEEFSKPIMGRLTEQFVGQQLLCNFKNQRELYCWIRPERTAKAEVDYMISLENKNIPLEVKSGPFGKLKSLKVLLNEFPSIENAIVLSPVQKIEKQGKIIRLPLFSIFS